MIQVTDLFLSVSRQELKGIPWIFSNQVKHLDDSLLDDVRCAIVHIPEIDSVGVYSKSSLISVRLLPRSFAASLISTEKLSRDNFAELVFQHIVAVRQQKSKIFPFAKTESFRWIHGDADGVPGIVADDYGEFVTLQSSSEAGELMLPFVIAALKKFDSRPIFERSSGQTRIKSGLPERTRWIRGLVEQPSVTYAGIKMTFDAIRAQKTGLFLDQRFNLEFLKTFCSHASNTAASMLDICSYAGAWSAAASLGGVRKFTFIDADIQALNLAPINVSLNAPKDECFFETRHGDLFEELTKLKNESRTFDIVIADPPAFAKTKKHLPEATKAYSRLTKSAARLVKDGGLLAICSCSKNMDADTFWHTATRALDNSWILVHRGEQSSDHTIGTTQASTEYLKCLFFQKRDWV